MEVIADLWDARRPTGDSKTTAHEGGVRSAHAIANLFA
jgi:putative heme degradation protein